MSREICAVIHFFWLKSLPNPEISHEIDSVYGTAAIGLTYIELLINDCIMMSDVLGHTIACSLNGEFQTKM
jgi:hypothetical protein